MAKTWTPIEICDPKGVRKGKDLCSVSPKNLFISPALTFSLKIFRNKNTLREFVGGAFAPHMYSNDCTSEVPQMEI